LRQAKIPFFLVKQEADERAGDNCVSIAERVQAIALQKMAHVIIPATINNKNTSDYPVLFIVTADTMVENSAGEIYGKPTDSYDAIRMIKNARDGMKASSAFCLEKRVRHENYWKAVEHEITVVSTNYTLIMPDYYIDHYIQTGEGMECAGAVAIEGQAAQFVTSVHGSYTNLIGLPMFEVRQQLEKFNFFASTK
jgi:septum formation protein